MFVKTTQWQPGTLAVFTTINAPGREKRQVELRVHDHSITPRHVLDVLALLVRVTLICALPGHVQRLVAAHVQGNEQVRAKVAVRNVDPVPLQLLDARLGNCRARKERENSA